jgi:hypothetical protein
MKLPFYEIKATLLKPCTLQPRGNAKFQEQKFTFYLTPQQVSVIQQSKHRDAFNKLEYKKQIQVRFSLNETSCEQVDYFPENLFVKINDKIQPLPMPIPTNQPGLVPKRPPKALDVTSLCKFVSTSPNYIHVAWAVEFGKGFTISVYLVEKLDSQDLLRNLTSKGQRHPDFTRAVIKDKLKDNDNEIATTSCKVSLACPLGKMRMKLPCRSSGCDHLQCFDANSFIMMNEKKDKWRCPVCNKLAPYESLMIDGFFSEIVTSRRLPEDEHEIVLHNDASWDVLPPTINESILTDSPCPKLMKEKLEKSNKSEHPKIARKKLELRDSSPHSSNSQECIVLDSTTDSSIGNAEGPTQGIGRAETASPTIICLDDD